MVRDIPSQYILGGVDVPNLREDVAVIMKKAGNPCKCIRCREVHDNKEAISQAELVVREYRGSKVSFPLSPSSFALSGLGPSAILCAWRVGARGTIYD